MAQAPAGFEVYSGDDNMTLPLLAVGAIGVISVAAHWVGPQFRAVVDAFLAGDLATALAGTHRTARFVRLRVERRVPQPAAGQGGMRALGLRVGQCRLPMGEASPELDAQAAKILAALGEPVVTVPSLA